MQKYARNMQQYSTKYAGIYTNKQIRNMLYIRTISINMQKYAKPKYARMQFNAKIT